MKFDRFEEIKVWQESRILTKLIYQHTQSHTFCKDFGLKDQIQRAAVSVQTNIAEGFERNNNREFIRFLMYSKASCAEVRSLLYVAFDIGYLNEMEFKSLYDKSINIITQLSNFIKYLKELIDKNEK
jgi:four helix bundle protein